MLRNMLRHRLILGTAVACASAGSWCLAQAPATQPARDARDAREAHDAKAKESPPARDPWIDVAVLCANNWKFDALLEEVEPALKKQLENANTAGGKELVRAAAFRQFVKLANRIDAEKRAEYKDALLWLAEQPNLLPILMMAFGESDQPDRMLKVVAAVRDDVRHPDDFADLIAAVCVVFDRDEPEEGPPDVKRAAWVANYFINNRASLKFDPRALPWQVCVYLVDLKVEQPEVLWALDRYGKRGTVGGLYFEVPYDTAAFYQGADKKIDAVPYTLANLTRYGGICTDQSYFAVQTARILGVPAATVTGRGGAGAVAHAWVGFLETRGKQALWNFQSGRYEAQMYWTGNAVDPQTGQDLTEADLSLVAELQYTSPIDRLSSVALVKSIDFVPEADRPAVLMRAVDLSPGNRAAWLALADLGAAGKLSDAQLAKVAEVAGKFAAGSYPDFALQVWLKLLEGRPTLERIEKLDWIARQFPQRQDLVAACKYEQGRLLRAMKREPAALAAFGEILTKHLYAGPVVIKTFAQVDEMLVDADPRRLLAIYRDTWKQMPRPQISAYSGQTPWVQVGQRYVELLRKFGFDKDAANYEAQINVYVNATGTPARGR
jgi:hypothetical protein